MGLSQFFVWTRADFHKKLGSFWRKVNGSQNLKQTFLLDLKFFWIVFKRKMQNIVCEIIILMEYISWWSINRFYVY